MNYLCRFRTLAVFLVSVMVFASSALIICANPPSTTRPSTQSARGITLLGTVYECDGTSPISDVVMGVFEPGAGEARSLGKPMFRTGANAIGAFAFDEYIPQGRYDILVFGSEGAVIAAQPLVVAKDTATVTTIQIRAFGGSLEGTVFLASGLVAKGAKVVLHDIDHHKEYSAEADGAGRYKINHIVAGTYAMFAFDDKNEVQQADADIKIESKPVKKDFKLN
jgi:hypothetical protein